MDTKLKKLRGIGILLIAAVIIVPSIFTVLFYPAFYDEAEAVNDTEQSVTALSEDSLLKLYKGSYVLYKEMRNLTDNKQYVPSELFFDEEVAETAGALYEDIKYIREGINSVIYSWDQDFGECRGQFDYGVFNSQGSQTLSNTESNVSLSEFISNKTADIENGKYALVIMLQFNAAGGLTVTEYGGGEESEDYDSVLYSMHADNRLASAAGISNEYVYSVKAPKDITIVYAIPSNSNLFSALYIYYPTAIKTEEYEIWTIGVVALITVAAILLPFIKKLDISEFKFSRMPAELAIIIIILIAAILSSGMTGVIERTCNGEYSEMAKGFIGDKFSAIIVNVFNIGFWALLFMGWYSAVSSLRKIFVYGPWQYIKKYSWIYRVFPFCKRKFLQLYNYISSFDFKDSSSKAVLIAVLINLAVVSFICFFWVAGILIAIPYSVVVFILLRKYMDGIKDKYKKMLDATGQMANGNLDVSIEEDLGPFNSYKTEIKRVQYGFKKAVEKEVKSRNMRTELITNVSHDLKTPLTAIITYIGLLKDENITEEERRSYIDTLDKKSMRLKALIEDLFEISKADSGNVSLNIANIDLANLIRQVYFEIKEKSDEAGLEIRLNLLEKAILPLDSQKTYRIFENLFINCIKYSLKGTRVYVDMTETEDGVLVEIKNIAAAELNNVRASDLTERFVRGDMSRNTDGSGLGLAIAKSFTELQKGRLEINIDGDLFKVTLNFKSGENTNQQ